MIISKNTKNQDLTLSRVPPLLLGLIWQLGNNYSDRPAVTNRISKQAQSTFQWFPLRILSCNWVVILLNIQDDNN